MVITWYVLTVLANGPACAVEFSAPEPVVIDGYDGHAMEPFLTRDGRLLLFNDSNEAGVNTELHWAERQTPARFRYGGKIEGANTSALDGVPSMDRQGMLYFVSLRSYVTTLSTIYRAQFSEGRAGAPEIADGLSRGVLGQIVFDAEIGADGGHIYAVDGLFTGGQVPKSADIFVARRVGDRFERLPNSASIMANINTAELEYAPSTTANGLELFFTRLQGWLFWRKTLIMHATRARLDQSFGPPEAIESITGLVEAPTISSDGRTLYFHKKVGGTYRIYRAVRP